MGVVTVIFTIIAVLAAIVGTVFAYIYIVPEENEKSENKYIKFLNGLCNFKKLYIEDIMRALYIFATICVICCGAANLLSGILSIFFQSYMAGPRILTAIILIVVAPFIIRVTYEFIMLTILLVKNVIEINNKIKK